MLTFVASDEQGKLSNADQRRVKSHVLRHRKRRTPRPEERDDRLSAALSKPAQRRMIRFRLHPHGDKTDESTPTDFDGLGKPGNTETHRPIGTAAEITWWPVTNLPFFIAPLALDLDFNTIGILSTCSSSPSDNPTITNLRR